MLCKGVPSACMPCPLPVAYRHPPMPHKLPSTPHAFTPTLSDATAGHGPPRHAVLLRTPQAVVVQARMTVRHGDRLEQVEAPLVVPSRSCVDGQPTEAALRVLAREWVSRWQLRFGARKPVLRLVAWWAGRWLRLA